MDEDYDYDYDCEYEYTDGPDWAQEWEPIEQEHLNHYIYEDEFYQEW